MGPARRELDRFAAGRQGVMVGQEDGVVVAEVPCVELSQPLDLCLDVGRAAWLKGSSGFHAAESTVVQTTVGDDDRNDVVIHVSCVRRQDRHTTTEQSVQPFRSIEQLSRIVLTDTLDEGSERPGRDVRQELPQSLTERPPCLQGRLHQIIPEGIVPEYAVAPIGQARDVVLAKEIEDLPVLTRRVVDPVASRSSLQPFGRVRPVPASPLQEPQFPVQSRTGR